VYAIDVGYGQLAWKLQQDPRVIVMDRTNARYLEALPEPIDLVTVDVSFISLKLILPAAQGWLHDLRATSPRPERGHIVALIKPQFEAGREHVGKGGVVRSPGIHRLVLEDITTWADEQGLVLRGLIRSPITGAAGNVEFLAHWLVDGQERHSCGAHSRGADASALIDAMPLQRDAIARRPGRTE
jgi:23S rRNA (cytidine1920-2'-O)/16S rRNA (cytidine1409-2'-O)-methyltransferase